MIRHRRFRWQSSLHPAHLQRGIAPRARKTATSQRSSSASQRDAGMKRAMMAVAHSILTIGYTMLKTGRGYHESRREFGGSHLEQVYQDQLQRYFMKRLQRRGLTVSVEPAA